VNYVHNGLEFVQQSTNNPHFPKPSRKYKISHTLHNPQALPIGLLSRQLVHILLEQLACRLIELLVPDPEPDRPTGRIFVILLRKLVLDPVQIQAAQVYEAGTRLEGAFENT
jgi:hypothetical protein